MFDPKRLTHGSENERLEALWHLIETQINLAFDSISFVSDHTVTVRGRHIS